MTRIPYGAPGDDVGPRSLRHMPRDRRMRVALALGLAGAVAGLAAVAGLWWAVRALGVG